jgi:hypothetical protein
MKAFTANGGPNVPSYRVCYLNVEGGDAAWTDSLSRRVRAKVTTREQVDGTRLAVVKCPGGAINSKILCRILPTPVV